MVNFSFYCSTNGVQQVIRWLEVQLAASLGASGFPASGQKQFRDTPFYVYPLKEEQPLLLLGSLSQLISCVKQW